MASVMVDMRFFRASTVTYASRSGGGGLAARGLTRELFEASCTSRGAEVLAAGALSLWVHARLALLTTITIVPSPQMGPIWFQKESSKVRLLMTWDKRAGLS